MDVKAIDAKPWQGTIPVVVWIDKGKINEAVVTIETLLRHNPNVVVNVVHHKADSSELLDDLKITSIHSADGAPSLIRAIDLFGHNEKIVALRAGCLVRGSIEEMAQAPVSPNAPVGGVPMSWIWGDESKRDRFLKLDVDFHTLNTRVDGAFDVDCLVLYPKTIIERARSTGVSSVVDYARSKHGEIKTVVEFMNHMSPTNVGMPDSLYGHTEEIGFTLISPHETLEKKKHLEAAVIVSFRDRNFEWGDDNIYKPAYLMLPVAEFNAEVQSNTDLYGPEWVAKVAKTAELCDVMRTK